MKTYDIILQGSEATLENSIDLCHGLDWSEIEISEQNLPNKTYQDTVNGIEIYYDHKADYYFFAPEQN